MTILRSPSASVLCGCLCIALTGGCGLFKPGSASFASVKIANHSPEEIAQTTTQVFLADGYRGGGTGGRMVFEKEGSRMDNIAYEGIVGTHYGAQTVLRVKAEIVDLGHGVHRLQCQAYMVRDAGQGFMEEEQRLANVRSRPYQSLLNRVADQLK